ncbi:hypothetical protein BV22DRAFT_1191239 [Leucogyrophana mollusca]|uniref:Uncharacterized protein n=1 Tax=Leucogyrophana mollusca TaxID=85980 RepID=A0ACB8BYS1_9AGAM|nr:hypothetical protein BV22DRAFT_1191239 [Leucogyrophana mollusca]
MYFEQFESLSVASQSWQARPDAIDGAGLPANPYASINALPVELLLAILEPLCLEWQAATYTRPTRFHEDMLVSPTSPLSLASVCCWWMQVLLGLPTIWTRIIIQVDSQPTPLSLIKFFLAASRNLPLSVVITRRGGTFSEIDPYEATRVASAMRLIRHCIWRCVSLHVHVIQRSSLPKLGCGRLVKAPQLRDLKLDCRTDDEQDSGRPSTTAIARRRFRSPKLDTLDIVVGDFLEAGIRGTGWFCGVTELSLAHYCPPADYYVTGEALSLYHLLETLQPCASHLSSLVLTHLECRIGPGEPRLSFPSLKRVTLKNITSEAIHHFFRVVEGSITCTTLAACPINATTVSITNAQSPVTCLAMENFEDNRDLDPADFLELWTGETLFFRNCPFFTDDLLEYMDTSFDTALGRSFICPNLQRLGIIRCTDFSINALKALILVRRMAVIAWYGDAKTEAQYTGDIDRPTSIRKLEYMGGDAPPLSAEDRRWFQEHVPEFGWGTELVDIAEF